MAHDVQAYGKFCITHGIINDGSQDDRHNADLVLNYFENTWKEVITAETLERALPALRPHLKFKTTARLEFEKAMTAEPDRARQLDQWLQAHGGKPGQLVNTVLSDDTFENLSLLLSTLGGYEISTPRIHDAIDRIQNRPGRKLHYVPTPRRTEPVSPHAKADDGKSFFSDGLTPQRDGSLGKSPADYAREARQRSDRDTEAANQQRTGASAQSAAMREAKSKAESIQGSTHSETDQLKKIFVTSGTEIDWLATHASRLQMQKQFNRHRETVRFIR
jgi:hypothetical protein